MDPPSKNNADDSVFNRMKERGADTVRKIRDEIANRGSAVIFVVLALVVIGILITYLVVKMRGVDTRGTLVLGDATKLFDMTSSIRVEADKLAPTVNGQEFAFSFWLYLVDYQGGGSNPQLIFMRSTSESVGAANPIVALDGGTNRLYFAVRTNKSNAPTATTFTNPTNKFLIATIEYFPLQRWVNVVGVVKDDTLSLYMNSSLYTVANVSDLLDAVTQRPVFSACTGSIYVGKAGVAGFDQASAFISQLKFYNYALTPKDVASIYSSGPTASSLFTKLGLAGYGLRSPIYRID